MNIQSIKGVKDITPQETAQWQYIEGTAKHVLETYGYLEIRTPVFEKTALFARSIGESTDIVEKEMYTFKDKGGEMLTLRPEATASVVRAYIEHRMYDPPGTTKLFYCGPMFRHERPQAGRFRQFHQIGAEAIGSNNPYLDAEILFLLKDIFSRLHIADTLELQINSLGCRDCRETYRKELQRFIGKASNKLCRDCNTRYRKNPLRVLDCKRDGCKKVIEKAPALLDYACGACEEHFKKVRGYLEAEGMSYTINPRLVRGLDYYTRTAFEFVSDSLGAQNAVAGGGRYDYLIKELGGPDTPAVGFAIGLERLTLLLDTVNASNPIQSQPVHLVFHGDEPKEKMLALLQRFRSKGIKAEIDYDGKSIKSQMRKANKNGAAIVLIMGEDELSRKEITFRDMSKGEQKTIPIDDAMQEIEKHYSPTT